MSSTSIDENPWVDLHLRRDLTVAGAAQTHDEFVRTEKVVGRRADEIKTLLERSFGVGVVAVAILLSFLVGVVRVAF